MLRIENTVLPSPEQWGMVIEGMRNPKNSWHLSDSCECQCDCCDCPEYYSCLNKGEHNFTIGEADHRLMMGLAKGGAVHAKYRRMIPVFLTIDAPLYWWKEFDTYKVGTVANSCSTMHKIHAKEFTLDDFSLEHLNKEDLYIFEAYMHRMEANRKFFLAFADSEEKKEFWYRMIQMLPTSYNQKRTVMLNYEVLVNIYHSRKNHRLDEWHTFCDWIETLPYKELICDVG